MQVVTRKVPGGKLLRLKTAIIQGKLDQPQLSGDFFFMPADKLPLLERLLHGFPLSDTDILVTRITNLLRREAITISGFAPEDIAAMVKEL